MSEEKSAIDMLYESKDATCKNSQCGHAINSHVHFKMIKEDRIPLMYCSECRTQGKECGLTKF